MENSFSEMISKYQKLQKKMEKFMENMGEED